MTLTMCFKCARPNSAKRQTKDSTVALCKDCYRPKNERPGNPAYWAFRDRCRH